MGKHSVRGIPSGLPLNVVGRGSKHVARHAIGGGEYTTVDGITYSIAPQGPGKPMYRDKLHTGTCSNPACPGTRGHDGPCMPVAVGQWRRPHPGEMPPGWTPKAYATNVTPIRPMTDEKYNEMRGRFG